MTATNSNPRQHRAALNFYAGAGAGPRIAAAFVRNRRQELRADTLDRVRTYAAHLYDGRSGRRGGRP